jgi:hypothetical protein
MKTVTDTIEIPKAVLESVDTLDELEDWLRYAPSFSTNRRIPLVY